MAEVSVERAFVLEGLHKLAQVAEIGSEFVGRDRGIFKTLPAQRFAGDVRSDTKTGLADLPDAPGHAWVGKEAHAGRGGGEIENLHQGPRLGFGFGGSACA